MAEFAGALQYWDGTRFGGYRCFADEVRGTWEWWEGPGPVPARFVRGEFAGPEELGALYLLPALLVIPGLGRLPVVLQTHGHWPDEVCYFAAVAPAAAAGDVG